VDDVGAMRLGRLRDRPAVARAVAGCPASWPLAPDGLASPEHVVPLGVVLAGTALGREAGRWWLQLDEELSGLVAMTSQDGGEPLAALLAAPPLSAADVDEEDDLVWSWSAAPGDGDPDRTAAAVLTALAAAHRSHVDHHSRALAGLGTAADALGGLLAPLGFRRRGTLFVREASPGVVQSVYLTAGALEAGITLPSADALLTSPGEGLATAVVAPAPDWPLPLTATLRWRFDEAAGAEVPPLLENLATVPALLADPARWRSASPRPELVRLVLLAVAGRRDEAQRAAAEVHAAVAPQVRPFALRVVAGLGLEPPPLGCRPDRTPADDAFLAAWAAGAPARLAELHARAAADGVHLPGPRRGVRALRRWLESPGAGAATGTPESTGWTPLRAPRDPGRLRLSELVATYLATGVRGVRWTVLGDGALGIEGGRGPAGSGFPAVERVYADLAAGRPDPARWLADWRRWVGEARAT
jgi:hypothetical protein